MTDTTEQSELKGTFIRYIDKRLNDKALVLVGQALQIINEYDAQGLDLTLRQLYYQFVARGLLENDDRNYERLGTAVNDGRLCGLLPWDKLIDHERNLMGLNTHASPRSFLKDKVQGYRRDLWQEQQWRPEVWVEKKALIGVISDICNQLRVDFFATKGYNSQSEQWRAGQRFAGYIRDGQRPIVFHLGDHDPSGVDMTRDNRDRLEMFAGTPVMVQRLALNMNQVEEFQPPENPLKMKAGKLSDSRAKAYVAMMEERGSPDPYVSWELDALEPTYIRNLISDAVKHVRDEEVWGRSLAREVADRDRLKALAEEFV
jgi:hypothetical protein